MTQKEKREPKIEINVALLVAPKNKTLSKHNIYEGF